MVLVVHVRVHMLNRVMNMLVIMILGQMQPDAEPHEHTRGQELHRHWLAKEDHSGQSA
jgi:hypothetical protein